MVRWIIFGIVYALLTAYGLQAIKTIFKYNWVQYVFIAIALLVLGNFIFQFVVGPEGRVLTQSKSYAFGFLLVFLSFNIVVVPILLGEDVLRLIFGVYDKYASGKESLYIPSRRKFVSQLALGLATIPFSSLLYGMYKGKYDYRVLKYTLHFEDLPEAFDGYRITQISDVHSGSFDDRNKVAYGIDLIKKQESDMILFTGDMVNNKAEEMHDWKDLFGQLEAKDGVYSVLGNHDYGDYVEWNSEADKHANLEELKQIQKDMGFDLLLNESRFIERNGQRLALVGVENWGRGPFKKAGDLKKAVQSVDENDFKILMSHDPSHWEDVVVHDDYHYHLTLSGHTHGMQFGIEIPGWVKWSPAKWRYKYWAGIYEQMGQYINVNRGFGYLGFPGRTGIWPEVTVIELRKGKVS
ncbi:metallophosphoesterase [Mangrovimonas xylaniphaga]|uniref:metallophosphoesterase n=1 Tax=Mangrovimonas xylaniphaga TaxID=1645915 RepID=UPI0006B54288|nr:metallophosphoesterase [Mangrovimonas xylaniphaga]